MATGWLWDERFAWHDTSGWTRGHLEPAPHFENGQTKRRFLHLVELSGLHERLTPLRPRPATREEVLRVHTERHLDWLVERAAAGGGDAGDGETPFGHGSDAIALVSAGGAITAVDAVLDGTVDNAYALVRPPGHHAEADRGMGYCLLNNVAIAARHAQAGRGLERVAIVDWDVHHGNGTQSVFWTDPTVLTVSLHQDNLYPVGSGRREHNGDAAGAGANVNVPLPAGSGLGAYEAALRDVVVPALERFRPELVLVASGLDAGGMDPLGRQCLHSDAYRVLTEVLLDAAGRLCGGRLAMTHEGGYEPLSSPFLGLAIVETLAGADTSVEDPWLPGLATLPEQALLDHHAAAVRAAAELVERVPAGPRDAANPSL